jgi:hypothetical protein
MKEKEMEMKSDKLQQEIQRLTPVKDRLVSNQMEVGKQMADLEEWMTVRQVN